MTVTCRYLQASQRNLSREHASYVFEFADTLEVDVNAHVRACVSDAAPRECIDHVIVRIVFVHLCTRRRIRAGLSNCTFLDTFIMMRIMYLGQFSWNESSIQLFRRTCNNLVHEDIIS